MSRSSIRDIRPYDETSEFADPDELRALQLHKLKAVLHQVRRNNPFYRRVWAEAGVDVARIESITDFARTVPLVDKSMFLHDQLMFPPHGSRVSSDVPQSEPLELYTTSGTSGQGAELHAQTRREVAGMVDMYRFGLTWAGMTSGQRVALTLPVTMLAGGRVEYQAASGFGASVMPLGNYDSARKMELIEQFRPPVLLGSTSYFAHLAATEPDVARRAGVRTLLTGLEGVGMGYIANLESAWAAKAYDRFGCAQMRSDFMFTCERGFGDETDPGILHGIEPFVLVEVLDPATGRPVNDGEYGEIVVTSLFHVDNPLIRCRLRDGGVYRAHRACSCGRTFAGVEVCSIGRTDDVRKIKGINVFPQAVDRTIFSVPGVAEYHVNLASASDESDIATVTIMPDGGGAPGEHASMIKQVAEDLRKNIGIRFIVRAGEVARSEYKAKRWTDERRRT